MDQYLKSGLGRVFLLDDLSTVGEKYKYHNCMKVESSSYGARPITPVYCGDGKNLFRIGIIKGIPGEYSTTLTGRITLGESSLLKNLAEEGCPFNLQVHYGLCNNPSDFNEFDYALILENAFITDYTTDPLSAMSPEENAVIQETVTITFENMYEVIPKEYEELEIPLYETGYIVDIQLCETEECLDCTEGNKGIYILDFNGTDELQIVYSLDMGETWNIEAVPGIFASIDDNPYKYITFYCCSGYLYLIVNQSYALGTTFLSVKIEDLLTQTTVYWQERITTPGYVAGFHEGCITDNRLLCFRHDTGTGERIPVEYIIDENEVTEFLIINFLTTTYQLSSASIYSSNLYAVLQESGRKLFVTKNSGKNWNLYDYALSFGGQYSVATDVLILDDYHWYTVHPIADAIIKTNNGGESFDSITVPDKPDKLAFPNSSIGYLTTGYQIFAGDAGFYKTIDGGVTWKLQFTYDATNYVLNEILVDQDNPNFVLTWSKKIDDEKHVYRSKL